MTFEKSFLKSKTLYAALFTIIAGFFPAFQDIVSDNPELSTSVVAIVFALLRVGSKKKIVAKTPKRVRLEKELRK